ncbi:hypothetical protein, partial [Mesorhizobium sp. M0592]|uniref:hypothetical protein n=1 Tax=Mesorhizobium sp. M0592 TaxID=2956967 RepID=UPI003339EB6D
GASAVPLIKEAMAAGEIIWAHAFEHTCARARAVAVNALRSQGAIDGSGWKGKFRGSDLFLIFLNGLRLRSPWEDRRAGRAR